MQKYNMANDAVIIPYINRLIIRVGRQFVCILLRQSEFDTQCANVRGTSS